MQQEKMMQLALSSYLRDAVYKEHKTKTHADSVRFSLRQTLYLTWIEYFTYNTLLIP